MVHDNIQMCDVCQERRESQIELCLVLTWGDKVWDELGFDSCSSYRAECGLWMVPQMTSWIDVRPGLWLGKPGMLVLSAGVILAQRTMRQEDPCETCLSQSKFKLPAWLCVDWKLCKDQCTDQWQVMILHIGVMTLQCIPCSVVSPKLSCTLRCKTRRVGWCDGNSTSFRTKELGSSAVWSWAAQPHRILLCPPVFSVCDVIIISLTRSLWWLMK